MKEFIEKNQVRIVLIALILVILGTVGVLVYRYNNLAPVQPQQIFSTPETTPIATTNPIPVSTATLTPGNIWIVSAKEVDVIKKNGYKYIVDEFVNRDKPTLHIRFHCGAPGDPAPEIGQKYFMNQWGVLVPVGDDEDPSKSLDSPLQRFYPIR